ncbi:hypothetical protein SELMODRAFT_429295 [Selaginella moellendorffii]|uniref:Uncharacterized protein n=1 Tax=Selaginella moellendorffii TaxID=88036 RepID=D8T5Q0_SELML|nr:hypothetical protein SELMODRAFT_429295 [Selaginella moellendorffii]
MGLEYQPYFLMAYDPDSMAWSCHKHFVDDRDPVPHNGYVYQEYGREATSLCGVLRWKDRSFMVTHSFSSVVVWELDTVAGEWKVLSSRRYKELYGKKPSREHFHIQALLVGSTIVFSDCYETLYAYAPYAYNLEDSTWHSSTCYASADTDTALGCAFIPSFNIEP